MVSAEFPLADGDGIGAFERRGALDDGYASAFQQLAIDAVETLDFRVLVGYQGWPVKADIVHGHLPAVTRRIVEILTDVGAIDEQLLGNTAHIDTGAAEIAAFNNGHPRAALGRHAGESDTAGTGTNND